MMTHAMKTWMQYYHLQQNGEKLFELRKDDRLYKSGDYFLSQEFNNNTNEYTGRETKYLILYVLRNVENFGLKNGYCILQLKEIKL